MTATFLLLNLLLFMPHANSFTVGRRHRRQLSKFIGTPVRPTPLPNFVDYLFGGGQIAEKTNNFGVDVSNNDRNMVVGKDKFTGAFQTGYEKGWKGFGGLDGGGFYNHKGVPVLGYQAFDSKKGGAFSLPNWSYTGGNDMDVGPLNVWNKGTNVNLPVIGRYVKTPGANKAIVPPFTRNNL